MIYYYLNTDYIVEFFCINKEKPELSCSGKCFLSSELEKQQDNQKDLPASVKEKGDIQFVAEEPASLVYMETTAGNTTSTLSYMRYFSQDFCEDIFHPPIS